ncbi:hypothetical protein ACFL0V_04860 [Nanoarchaeota archaeon]
MSDEKLESLVLKDDLAIAGGVIGLLYDIFCRGTTYELMNQLSIGVDHSNPLEAFVIGTGVGYAIATTYSGIKQIYEFCKK